MKNTDLKTGSAATRKVDLCINCAYYFECGFRNLSASSIIFCQEFVLMADPVTRVGEDEKFNPPLFTNGQPVASEANASEMMGLCRNCLNRRTCMYPKPVGGVWHCEEYA